MTETREERYRRLYNDGIRSITEMSRNNPHHTGEQIADIVLGKSWRERELPKMEPQGRRNAPVPVIVDGIEYPKMNVAERAHGWKRGHLSKALKEGRLECGGLAIAYADPEREAARHAKPEPEAAIPEIADFEDFEERRRRVALPLPSEDGRRPSRLSTQDIAKGWKSG